jgi:hypothetical protein
MSRSKNFFLSLISAILLLPPSGADAGLLDSCNFLPKKEAPKWVKTGWSLPDHYVGVGQAGKVDKKDEQIEASKQSALNDLSQKISVQVSGSLKDTLTSTSSGDKEIFDKEIELVTETSVKETLRDWKVEDRWLDRKNCMLWTLVTVSVESVEEVAAEMQMKSRFKAMVGFYDKGAGPNKVPGKKKELEYLKDAVGLLAEIDFDYLPDARVEEYYSEKYEEAIAALEKDIKNVRGKTIIVPMSAPDLFPPDVVKKIVLRFINSTKNVDQGQRSCGSEKECISMAGSDGYSRLALLKLKKKVEQGSMGAFKGTMTIEAVVYEVSTKKVVGGPVSGFAQVVSWTEDNIDWSMAIEKIFKSEKFAGIL